MRRDAVMIFSTVLRGHSESPSLATWISLRSWRQKNTSPAECGQLVGSRELLRRIWGVSRGRGLSPTLSGSETRAWLCVNAAKIVVDVHSSFRRSFMILFATYLRLGDVHWKIDSFPTSSAYWISMQREGYQCSYKFIREMKTETH